LAIKSAFDSNTLLLIYGNKDTAEFAW